ncbi:UDP-arabinose 4-epimerase [Arachis hypogaea]|nr:UDP-arabinose 4-epimerase [Arachis hypogaea]
MFFYLLGLDYADPKWKGNFLGKVFLAAGLTALCIIMIKQSPSLSSTSPFAIREPGVTHVLVTGGAGYIGSHATLRLLKENYRVTIVDNLSRGNMGAVRVLQNLFPEPGRLQFIYADLGDQTSVNKIFLENKFDAVMHFAAVAYVGESTEDPLKFGFKRKTGTSLVYLINKEIDEELLQEVVNMGFDRNQLVESLCNRIQNEMGLVMICLKSYGGCAGPLMDAPRVQDRVLYFPQGHIELGFTISGGYFQSSRENDLLRLSLAWLIVWRHHPWLMATSHPRSENYAHALCHNTANHWLVPAPTGIESLDSFAFVTNAQHLRV